MKEKINQDYIEILKEYRFKLDFFINNVNNHRSFIKDISWYLRNLYCKKGKIKPFLYRVFEKYNISMNVQISASIEKRIERWLIPEHIIESIKAKWDKQNDWVIFSQKTSSLIWFDNLDEKYLEIIDIFDSINCQNEIFIQGDSYSISEFIQIISDSFDAHIDDEIHKKGFKFLNWVWILIWWLTQSDKAIIDLSIWTIALLDILINFLETWEKNKFIIEKIWKQ